MPVKFATLRALHTPVSNVSPNSQAVQVSWVSGQVSQPSSHPKVITDVMGVAFAISFPEFQISIKRSEELTVEETGFAILSVKFTVAPAEILFCISRVIFVL